MSRWLLKVRLTEENQKIARGLRARGVSISALVRRALRIEAQQRAVVPVDADALIAEMLERFPSPVVARRSKRPDTTNRRAMRNHVAARGLSALAAMY